jgi:uridine monophosphate synthetase
MPARERAVSIRAEEIIWREKKPILGKEASILLTRIGAIKFGDFTLSSGGKSPYYVDLRLAPSYPEVLDRMGDLYVEVIKNEIEPNWKISRIAGVPTAGLPIATVVSQKMRIPLIYVRKEHRTHGLGKTIEGVVSQEDNVLLVDDIVTTGTSTIEEAAIIRGSANVRHVVVLVDREQGGPRNLEQADLSLHPLVKITEMIGYLKELGAISTNIYETVTKYISASQQLLPKEA